MRTLLGLVLAILVSASVVRAEYLPDGCYVAFYDTSRCWSAFDGVAQWTVYPDRSLGAYHYGDAVEAIIWAHAGEQGLKQACYNDYNSLLANYNSVTSDRSTCIDDYNSLVDQYNGQLESLSRSAALIKKLRRACGKKCRKIK